MTWSGCCQNLVWSLSGSCIELWHDPVWTVGTTSWPYLNRFDCIWTQSWLSVHCLDFLYCVWALSAPFPDCWTVSGSSVDCIWKLSGCFRLYVDGLWTILTLSGHFLDQVITFWTLYWLCLDYLWLAMGVWALSWSCPDCRLQLDPVWPRTRTKRDQNWSQDLEPSQESRLCWP